MMKWLRRYNKQIMGVAASFLLIVWLAGDALQSAGQRNVSGEVIGRTAEGPITMADRNTADFETNLQQLAGFNWQAEYGQLAGQALNEIDYIMLKREADRAGIHISLRDAKRIANQAGLTDARVRQVALNQNVTTDRVYAALVGYFKVGRMIALYQTALQTSEQGLRLAARDQLERATINAVKLPAVAFTDPEQTFSEDRIKEQYEKYKDSRSVSGSQTFGYYRQPQVTIQYVEIDPEKVKSLLGGTERAFMKRALEYWKENGQSDPKFRRSQEQIDAIRDAMPVQEDDEGNDLPKPPAKAYFETFEEAQTAAIEIVKSQEAEAESRRLAYQLIQRFAEPWFGVATKPTEYKPVPEGVNSIDHYEEILNGWSLYPRYKDAIRVDLLGPIGESSLAENAEFGGAFLGAFAVEGLTEIPEDTPDRTMYKALWETSTEPIQAANGKFYVYRVIKSEKGRPPSGLDEVRDEVIADLRLAAAMDRAVQAGQELAADAADSSLEEAWNANQELADRVTPDKGGYVSRLSLSRNNPFWGRLVPQIGAVDETFVEIAFRLAADPENQNPEEARLADLNLAVVIEGVSQSPLYQEMYDVQRPRLANQLNQQRMLEAIRTYLQPDQIRERNGYKPGAEDRDTVDPDEELS